MKESASYWTFWLQQTPQHPPSPSRIHGWCNCFKWPCSVRSREPVSIYYVSIWAWIIHRRHSAWWNYAILGAMRHFAAHTQPARSVHMTPSPIYQLYLTDYTFNQVQSADQGSRVGVRMNSDLGHLISLELKKYLICLYAMNIMIWPPIYCKCHPDWSDREVVS